MSLLIDVQRLYGYETFRNVLPISDMSDDKQSIRPHRTPSVVSTVSISTMSYSHDSDSDFHYPIRTPDTPISQSTEPKEQGQLANGTTQAESQRNETPNGVKPLSPDEYEVNHEPMATPDEITPVIRVNHQQVTPEEITPVARDNHQPIVTQEEITPVTPDVIQDTDQPIETPESITPVRTPVIQVKNVASNDSKGSRIDELIREYLFGPSDDKDLEGM